jgi:hypothetical protein
MGLISFIINAFQPWLLRLCVGVLPKLGVEVEYLSWVLNMGPKKKNRNAVLPNPFWRAVPLETLRSSPTFFALPPEEHITVSDPSCFRFLRQEESAWSELHDGVLTSGQLTALLGFRERKAAKILGIPKHMVGHEHLTLACELLRTNPHRWLNHPQKSTERPETHNVEAVLNYNRRSQHQHTQFPTALPPEPQGKQEQCLLLCALSGINQLRQSWGKVHEAAALMALTRLLQGTSTVHEVSSYMTYEV